MKRDGGILTMIPGSTISDTPPTMPEGIDARLRFSVCLIALSSKSFLLTGSSRCT